MINEKEIIQQRQVPPVEGGVISSPVELPRLEKESPTQSAKQAHSTIEYSETHRGGNQMQEGDSSSGKIEKDSPVVVGSIKDSSAWKNLFESKVRGAELPS